MSNIIETIIAPAPSEGYSSYLYRYTNLENSKMYLGIHKGDVVDAYKHSSTCKEFAAVFANPESKLRFEVIGYGSYEEMQCEESTRLTKVDARNSSKYYNKTNGSSRYRQPDLDKCQEMVKLIESGTVFPIVEEEKETVRYFESIQCRYQHDDKMQRLIRDFIEDENGSTKKCNPLIVFEGRGSEGGFLLVDGNTTRAGVLMSKHAVHIDVMYIPEEDSNDLTLSELRLIGLLLNRRPDVVKKSASPADGIKFVIENVKLGMSHNAMSNVKALKAFGFTGSLKKGEIKTILKDAKHILDKDEELSERGNLFINYKSDTHKNRLVTTVEQYTAMKQTCSLYMSSEKFSLERIVEKIEGTKSFNKNHIVIVIHHPNKDQKTKWTSEIAPKWTKILTNCGRDYYSTGNGFTHEFVEMPMWETDTTVTS